MHQTAMPDSLELPPLGWRLPDGSDAPIDVISAVVFVLSGVTALMIGLSGYALGNPWQAALLAAASVLFAASVVAGSRTWAIWLRIAGAAAGVIVWWSLLRLTTPGEPLAAVTFVGLAVACAWCGLAFVGRPQLWQARPRADGRAPEGSGALFWIEEV